MIDHHNNNNNNTNTSTNATPFDPLLENQDQELLFFKELGLRRYHRIQINTTKSKWIGSLLLIFSISFGLIFIYAAIISKLLPETGIGILDAIKNDEYFCYLIPLSIIPTYAVIYLNWVAITHFTHN